MKTLLLVLFSIVLGSKPTSPIDKSIRQNLYLVDLEVFREGVRCCEGSLLELFWNNQDSVCLIRVELNNINQALYLYDFPVDELSEVSKMQVFLSEEQTEIDCYELVHGNRIGEAVTTTLIKESNCPDRESIHVRLFD